MSHRPESPDQLAERLDGVERQLGDHARRLNELLAQFEHLRKAVADLKYEVEQRLDVS